MNIRAVLMAMAGLAGLASAQNAGTLTAETHPKLTVSTCTVAGGCTASTQSVVLDANWRWLHSVTGSTNCYTGTSWDATLCPDGATCAANCALDGADYTGTYGVTATGNSLRINFVTKGANTNVGARLYLMDTTDTKYQSFNLLNKEFTMTVDVSNLPCGLNGAVYFVEMPTDGGSSAFPANKAGAKYGTGYCDSQCPQDIKFINGIANVVGWNTTSATGKYGTCCNEMDIWEANSISAAYTPHPCTVTGLHMCDSAVGTDCGAGADRNNGVCDKNGCDFNSYRMGDTTFYGSGLTIDTTKPLTLVTQFITSDGTDTGTLSEIRRFYVQNGQVIPNSQATYPAVSQFNSITTDFCTAQKTLFADTDTFSPRGGLTAMGESMARGMVLALSLWDDHAANMLWLDSTYPVTATGAGAARGTCATTSGVPADVEANVPNSFVIYSDIRTGEIGSTFSGTTVSPAGTTAVATTSAAAAATSAAAATTSAAAAATTTAAAATTSAAAAVTSAVVATSTSAAGAAAATTSISYSATVTTLITITRTITANSATATTAAGFVGSSTTTTAAAAAAATTAAGAVGGATSARTVSGGLTTCWTSGTTVQANLVLALDPVPAAGSLATYSLTFGGLTPTLVQSWNMDAAAVSGSTLAFTELASEAGPQAVVSFPSSSVSCSSGALSPAVVVTVSATLGGSALSVAAGIAV
ncbi:hypothetical protein HK405_006265 [Cladochytrium tenue]|nr:hypothetical protein HK405_006265 [Cladochytrium tenue]